MSTVSEVLAAVHAGLEVLAVSLVTNRCEDQPDTEADPLEEVAGALESKKVSFLDLVSRIIARTVTREGT